MTKVFLILLGSLPAMFKFDGVILISILIWIPLYVPDHLALLNDASSPFMRCFRFNYITTATRVACVLKWSRWIGMSISNLLLGLIVIHKRGT